MNENQLTVLHWWYSNQPYSEGISLLAQFGKNKFLLSVLSRKSAHFGQHKLAYELIKSVGLDFQNIPLLPEDEMTPEEKLKVDELEKEAESLSVSGEPVKKKVSSESSIQDNAKSNGIPEPVTSHLSREKEDLSQYPKIIRRLKYEYQEAYVNRSKAFNEMQKLPPVNTADIVETRHQLLIKVKAFSDRIDFLFPFVDNYDKNKIIPSESTVWPSDKSQTSPVMTLDELKKRRTSLMNQNYKDSNRLRFQTSKVQKKENPLPDGPRREEITARMKIRSTSLALIEKTILQFKTDAANTNTNN